LRIANDRERTLHEPGSARSDATRHLGGILAKARKGRFTLEQLAEVSGLSASGISQLERGLGNPSFTTLLKLANALELPWHALFTGPTNDTPGFVPANARKKLVHPNEDLTFELLTPDFQGDLAVVRAHIPPHFNNSTRPFRHPGEECTHILSGTLEVLIGSDTFVLEQGDSLTYDSGVPHCWCNPGSSPAEVISAVTPVAF